KPILFKVSGVPGALCKPGKYDVAISSTPVTAVGEVVIHARRRVGKHPECGAFEESREVSVTRVRSEGTFQHGDGYHGEARAVIPIGRSFRIDAVWHVFVEGVG